MIARRNIGLRIVVGVVGFDLLMLKLALEASDKVSDQTELAWAVRIAAVGAFVVLAGMLIQIESKNRIDRGIYRAAARRAEEIRKGHAPPAIDSEPESLRYTVKQAWATTWPLIGVLALTITICWTAALFSDPQPPATVIRQAPGR